MGFFDTLKNKIFNKKDSSQYLEGFSKTSESIGSKLNRLKPFYKGVDEDFIEEVIVVMLEADIGIHTCNHIIDVFKKKVKLYSSLTFKETIELLVEAMHDVYLEKPFDPSFKMAENGPTVILMVGVNGAGKTTSIAKIANRFKNEGKKVALVAADTFRAGAIDQLNEWAMRLDVPIVKGAFNSDPSSVIVDGCKYANENDIDILIIDTAGRLQNKVNLMKELDKMKRVIGKFIPGGPHNTWLVIDATTGQNGLSQAKEFNEITKLDGIILSKMDGTAKGGIVLGIKDTLGIGVIYLGLGEGINDLKDFDLDMYIYSITKGISND